MKPEEAISILRTLQGDYIGGYISEAINMAIEALKEMSVEEYRQGLMEVFHRTDHDELLTYVVMPKEEELKSLEHILRQYKFEPRPHGEWRVHSHCSDGFSYKCSLCGRVVNQGHWFEQNEILSVYPYCHCGAKMVGVENPFKWYFSLGKSDNVTDMKHIKVGDTIYTQDDDKQGWTGREG